MVTLNEMEMWSSGTIWQAHIYNVTIIKSLFQGKISNHMALETKGNIFAPPEYFLSDPILAKRRTWKGAEVGFDGTAGQRMK